MCKQNLINAGQSTVENELKADGFTKALATKYGFSNPGAMRNAVASCEWFGLKKPESRTAEGRKAESTDGEKPARAKRVKGCLPKRVENWVIRKLECDDDDDLPEVTAEVVEGFIIADNANWNMLIGKLGEEELASFEAWLGEPCTMTRRRDAAEQGILSNRAKARAKATAYLKKALECADPELVSALNDLCIDLGIDL